MAFLPADNAFANLRRFMRPPRAAVEHCELCGAEVFPEHQHLIEPESRKLLCACDPCTILFSNQGGKYRRVGRTARLLTDFRLSAAQWDNLLIPINLAFFLNSGPRGKTVALYPSPAGPTEALLPEAAWQEIVAANPVLTTMAADTEALLVNRVGQERRPDNGEYYLAPIDKCYELTGLIRAHWRGLGGGAAVWEEIRRFFTQLKNNATVIGENGHPRAAGSE